MTYFSLLNTFNLQTVQMIVPYMQPGEEEPIKALRTESKSAIDWFKMNETKYDLNINKSFRYKWHF